MNCIKNSVEGQPPKAKSQCKNPKAAESSSATKTKPTTAKVRAAKATETDTLNGGEVTADGDDVDAVESLGKELQEKIELIQKLVRRADRRDVERRYEIARHFLDVKDGDGNKFGDGAVQKLANALGWARSRVYAYAVVARAWNTREEAVAAAQEMNCGWGHLVEIANAPEKKRQALINAVREDGLSLRALQKAKKKIAATASRAKPAPSLGDTTPSLSLTEALQDFAVNLTQFEEHGGPHANRLAEAVASAQPIALTPEFTKDLKEVRNRIEAVCQKGIKAIDAGLAAAKQAKSEPATTKSTATAPQVSTATAPQVSTASEPQATPKPNKPVAAGRSVEVASTV